MLNIENGVCSLDDGTLAGTTLSLLEGCKKLALWSKNPCSAIWAATMTPRITLGEDQNIHAHLKGKYLKNLLRWRYKSDSSQLIWQHAA